MKHDGIAEDARKILQDDLQRTRRRSRKGAVAGLLAQGRHRLVRFVDVKVGKDSVVPAKSPPNQVKKELHADEPHSAPGEAASVPRSGIMTTRRRSPTFSR